MSGDDTSPKSNPPSGESRQTFEGNKFEDDALQRVHSQLLREKEEPSEGFSYPPLVLVFLFMVLAFGMGIYVTRYSGGFSPFVFNEHLSGPGEGVAAGPVEKDPLVEGKKIYVKNCATCHQQDGRGLPGVYPPLVNSNWAQDKPERIIKVVLSGLQGEVFVNGQKYSNAMTPFGAQLEDDDIAYVLTFVRTSPEFENNSYAVSEELVASVRAEYGNMSESWTQPELEAIHGPVTGDWKPAEGEAAPAAEAPADAEAAG